MFLDMEEVKKSKTYSPVLRFLGAFAPADIIIAMASERSKEKIKVKLD